MTDAELRLSDTENFRRTIVRAMIAGEVSATDAARELGISPQRVYTLCRRFEAEGDMAFVDRRRSGRSKLMTIEMQDAIVALVQAHYQGWACIDIKRALAAHHSIEIKNYTLRRLLIAQGLITVRSRVLRTRQSSSAVGRRPLRFRYRAVRLRDCLSRVQVALPPPWSPSPELMAALESLSRAAAALIRQAKHEMTAYDFLATFDRSTMSYDQFEHRFPAPIHPRRH